MVGCAIGRRHSFPLQNKKACGSTGKRWEFEGLAASKQAGLPSGRLPRQRQAQGPTPAHVHGWWHVMRIDRAGCCLVIGLKRITCFATYFVHAGSNR